MTTSLTIYPDSASSLPPAQARKTQAPQMVNNDFIGGFSDILHVINPLEHIPIVSNIYHALTGSQSSPGAQIAGDALFGGPLGLIASIINSAFEQETGKDIAGSVFSAVAGKYQTADKLTS